MFTQVSIPTIDIFNGETNEFVGEARFNLTQETGDALLQMVNYARVPNSLILLDLDFYRPSANYLPPNMDTPLRRNGIIRALFTEGESGQRVPLEIRFKFRARARSAAQNPYFFDSVEYTDLHLDSVREVTYP